MKEHTFNFDNAKVEIFSETYFLSQKNCMNKLKNSKMLYSFIKAEFRIGFIILDINTLGRW